MEPHDCEVCACEMFRWNGRNYVLRDDEPYTCECQHAASRHRYREPA